MMMSESQSGTSSGNDSAGGEIVLFGVRVTVDPMRKSVSMNDLSQYITPDAFVNSISNNSIDNKNLDASAVVAADNGYASADDAVRNLSNAGKERKRGAPWTEDEHKLFLLGLEKVGKGDWRGISRNFVKTRTPTQVASHAQKYFLRRNNLNRRRRRSSIFDIPTDLDAAIAMEENQDNKSQPTQISPLSGFPVAPFPALVGPVPSPLQTENQMETKTFNNGNQLNSETTLVRPIPSFPHKRAADLNANQKHERNSISLSLNLSLSWDNNQRDSSTFQVIPGCNNGNGIISVG
ncbi:transcription factor MYB1R1 [Rutidosis leptorrhynchoides]|uniref:transcription factor MYB1R1 n=1 Tax=Rutidosis leptorrhynchoides TaxID=125765 RepID=UPI003A993B5D